MNQRDSTDHDAIPGAGIPRADDAIAPPDIVATPADVQHRSAGDDAGSDADIRWWRPSWSDVARSLGWRWIFLTPAVVLIAMLGLHLYLGRFGMVLIALEIKLTLFVIGVTIALAGFAVRRAVRARSEPFCIYCGYALRGLPDNYRCPECGRPYTWRLIAEYRRDPEWFIERWKARHMHTRNPSFEAGATRRKRRAKDGTE